MSILNEGMRPGDLEDLVLPMISIDEYESKLDDDAIVVGFYVHDRDAAEDLNRYIQKSPVQLLDTEVSPAPDQHGYYLVFIEMLNDRKIVDNMKAILDEVAPLCGNDDWQMRLRGDDGVTDFSAKALGKRMAELRDDMQSHQNGETEGRVLEFLTPSDLGMAVVENAQLIMTGDGSELRADIVDIGDSEDVIQRTGLHGAAVSLDFAHLAESLKMTRLLGEGWHSSMIGECVTLCRAGSETMLVLRNARWH
jgi:hypothetical protein